MDISSLFSNAKFELIPALCVGVVLVFTALLRIFCRLRWMSCETVRVLQLALLALACECVRSGIALPAFLMPWLKALELILLAFLTVQIVVRLYIERYLEHHRRIFVARILRDLTTVVILALFALLILRLVLNVNLAAILTPSAILTAIVGLSMQDTIGNFISGLIIQVEKPFDLGDWIDVDGQRGQVREMNWRYTKIETTDKIYMIIPNNKISTEKTINYSKPTPVVKEAIVIGVSYDVPPVKVKQAIRTILMNNPHVLQKEACEVLLHEYGDSSIVYRIAYMIGDPGAHRQVRDEIYSSIWYQFQKHAIEIPYPIRSVIMKQPATATDLSEPVRLLGGLTLFTGVTSKSLEHLIRFGLTHTIFAGNCLFKEQDAGDSMFFILNGDFNVIKDQRVIKTLHKGDFFGEMSLLTGEKRAAGVVAATEGTLLEVDRHAFKIIIDAEPGVLSQIEAIFSERCKNNAEQARLHISPEEFKDSLFQRFKKRFGLA